MLPAWATVVIAIAGSAIAGVFVGVLRNRYERAEAFRDRMLTAADDLATGLAQALLVVQHAVGELEGFLVEGQKSSGRGDVREAHRLTDEAVTRIARVELLFGLDSPAATSASAAALGLRRAAYTLEGDEDLNWIMDTSGKHYQAAADSYRTFVTSASGQIASYGRSKFSLVRRRGSTPTRSVSATERSAV